MTDYLLSTFLTEVDELLNVSFEAVEQEMKIASRYRQIKAAVDAYSHDRPDLFSEDESGDGGKYYVIVGASALLSDWVEGFSRVESLEYPAAVVASDEQPTVLELDDYNDEYRVAVSGVQTRYLYFRTAAPASTETWRIRYTVPYQWTVSATTISVPQDAHGFSTNDYIYFSDDSSNPGYIEAGNTDLASHRVTVVTDDDNFIAGILQTTTPDSDFNAIVYKAACLICRAISTHYSRIGESIANVDSGAHTTKATDFNARANKFCGMYNELMGLSTGDDGGTRDAPAGQFIDLDTTPGWRRGRRYLFHARR